MSAFLDSSAIVKLYVDEPGADRVRQLNGELVVSALAGVEVPAAFWRKQRMGDLSPAEASVLARGVEDDLLGNGPGGRRFSMIRVTPGVLQEAARLVAVHPLRAYDAVQLASAVRVASHDASIVFATFDRSLHDAAAAEGLTTLPR